MCKKCGCNTCETDGKALMLNESKAPRSILSEGLKHHMDANKPLTDNFYAAGSRDYFDLIAEARSLYSRGILDFTNKRDIELLTETDQGYFGVYEGKKVPLDFPIAINEAYSGFRRGEPEDPDSIPFEPTGSVSEFKEDLRALFGKFKGDLQNPEFIKGVAQVMVNWKSLLRSQIELRESLSEDERSEDKKIDILNKILSTLQDSEKDGEDREQDLEDLDISIDQMTAAITGKNSVAVDFDQDLYGRFASMSPSGKKKVKEIVESLIDEAKFKGKTVDLNKPTRGDSKKFKVYVNSGKKNADGSIKVKKVNFGHGGSSAKKAGQKTMSIRKSNPKARKAFRARHNCDNPGPKTMARYWSCKKW